jgi:hypothetical protein
VSLHGVGLNVDIDVSDKPAVSIVLSLFMAHELGSVRYLMILKMEEIRSIEK